MLVVQAVRVFDVLVLGPFLLRLARRTELSPGERALLEWAGLGTIVFNGVRFLQEAKD